MHGTSSVFFFKIIKFIIIIYYNYNYNYFNSIHYISDDIYHTDSQRCGNNHSKGCNIDSKCRMYLLERASDLLEVSLFPTRNARFKI
jgi:hypothetical protein